MPRAAYVLVSFCASIVVSVLYLRECYLSLKVQLFQRVAEVLGPGT